MAVVLTAADIAEYRQQLADSPEAIAALDVIETECEGYLEDAVMLLMIRETGKEPDRGFDFDEWSEKCRPVLCADTTKTLLELVNILTGLLGTTGVAVAALLFILNKFGLENFCKTTSQQG